MSDLLPPLLAQQAPGGGLGLLLLRGRQQLDIISTPTPTHEFPDDGVDSLAGCPEVTAAVRSARAVLCLLMVSALALALAACALTYLRAKAAMLVQSGYHVPRVGHLFYCVSQ